MTSSKRSNGAALKTYRQREKGAFRRWPILLAVVILLVSCAPLGATRTPEPTPTLTLPPTPTVGPTPIYPVLTLDPVRPKLLAFPGPPHYEGDLLTLEIDVGQGVEEKEATVTMQLDDGERYEVTGQWERHYLEVQFDTDGLTGTHTLDIEAEQGVVRVDEEYTFEVMPASQRPEQEEDAAWVSRDLECCTLHYITNTAAARDIEYITGVVEEAVAEFENDYPVELEEKLDIYFIDRMWFNGAFGGPGELLIVYTDRYYGPTVGAEGLEILVQHEMGHAVFPHFSYNEGLCVYLADGHYHPHPLPKRAAAMQELGYFDPEEGAYHGPNKHHEVIYLHQAAIVTYIIETYGWEGLQTFIEADNEDGGDFSEAGRNELFEQTLGVSQETFQSNFVDWIESQEPGEQVEDLELTIELQNLRRKYQDRYTPWPWVLLGFAEESFARPEYLRANIREPRTPAHIATELLIAHAQEALVADRYTEARTLIQVIDRVVSHGRLDDPVAREYGAIAYLLAEEGYEAVALELHDDRAEVQVTASPPELMTMTLHKVEGQWQLDEALESSYIGPATGSGY